MQVSASWIEYTSPNFLMTSTIVKTNEIDYRAEMRNRRASDNSGDTVRKNE